MKNPRSFPLRPPLLAAVLLLTAPAALAADWLLAAPALQVVPGQRFEVVVIGDGRAASWPARLPASIALPGGGPRIAVELVAIGKADANARQRRYFARWPTEVVGVATLALADHPSARVLLDGGAATRVVSAPAQAPAGGVAAGEASAATAPVATAPVSSVAPMARVADTPADPTPVEPSALGFHEPMYFLVGGKDPVSARFQFSFRYRIFDEQGVVAETIPVASGVYFGFTQTSLWDLQGESKPFLTRASGPRSSTAGGSTTPTSGVRSPSMAATSTNPMARRTCPRAASTPCSRVPMRASG